MLRRSLKPLSRSTVAYTRHSSIDVHAYLKFGLRPDFDVVTKALEANDLENASQKYKRMSAAFSDWMEDNLVEVTLREDRTRIAKLQNTITLLQAEIKARDERPLALRRISQSLLQRERMTLDAIEDSLLQDSLRDAEKL